MIFITQLKNLFDIVHSFCIFLKSTLVAIISIIIIIVIIIIIIITIIIIINIIIIIIIIITWLMHSIL